VLLELRADDESRIPAAREVASGAMTVGPVTVGTRAPEPAPLIIDRIA
jgi:thymidine phosphorylase